MEAYKKSNRWRFRKPPSRITDFFSSMSSSSMKCDATTQTDEAKCTGVATSGARSRQTTIQPTKRAVCFTKLPPAPQLTRSITTLPPVQAPVAVVPKRKCPTVVPNADVLWAILAEGPRPTRVQLTKGLLAAGLSLVDFEEDADSRPGSPDAEEEDLADSLVDLASDD